MTTPGYVLTQPHSRSSSESDILGIGALGVVAVHPHSRSRSESVRSSAPELGPPVHAASSLVRHSFILVSQSTILPSISSKASNNQLIMPFSPLNAGSHRYVSINAFFAEAMAVSKIFAGVNFVFKVSINPFSPTISSTVVPKCSAAPSRMTPTVSIAVPQASSELGIEANTSES